MPETPSYYAVIFSSRRSGSSDGYDEMNARLEELAASAPGFIGLESARGVDGFGVTVSYWETAEAIQAWRADVDHSAAQELGKSEWYTDYKVRVARVERSYEFRGTKEQMR